MTAELRPTDTDQAPAFRPGECSDHPGRMLVSAFDLYGSLGPQQYEPAGYRVPNVCPDPEHGPKGRGYRGHEPPVAARRCGWCGVGLWPADVSWYDVNERRLYCSHNHRLLAHRAGKRAARLAAQ